MAILHRHRSPSLWSPRRLPVEPVEIDFGHPLAAGLISCLLSTPRGFVDLIGKPRAFSTAAAWTAAPQGIAADNWVISNATTTDFDFTSGPWSVGGFANLSGAGGAGDVTIAQRTSYTSESVNSGWALGQNGTSNKYKFACYANDASTSYILLGTSTPTVGDHFLGAASNGTNLRRLIVDGTQEATIALNPNPATTTADFKQVDVSPGVWSGVYVIYAWTRDVSNAEWAWLNVEPFVLLRPIRRIYKKAATTLAVSLTGAATTSAAGSIGIIEAITLTGAAATASAGAIAGTVAPALSGAAVTMSAGTIAPTVARAITGAAATASAGSPAITSAESVALTGASVASGAGAMAITDTITLPSAAATASAGSAAPTTAESITLTGATATSAAGTPAITVTKALTGAAATSSAGSPSETIAIALGGVSGTATAGIIAAGVGLTLTGASVAAAAGNVSTGAGNNITLTGAAAASAAGTIAISEAVPLAGAAIVGSAGTIAAAVGASVAAPGTSAAATAGDIAIAAVITLTGAAAASAAGVPAKTIARALTGGLVTGSAGLLSASKTSFVAIPGVRIVASAGRFLFPVPMTRAMPPGYQPAPLGPFGPVGGGDIASALWVRRIVDVVNNSLTGKLNATLPVTLATGAGFTTVTDARISAFSALLLSPVTANAAAIHDGIYVSDQHSGEATLTHPVTANMDCEFTLLIIG